MNNLRKFETEGEYSAATLNYPSVSWVTATDNVYFDKTAPAAFSGLTVYYNITDISQPTVLFDGGGSGSGSGSGSGGALPSAMIIDGTAVEVANTYQFSTTGEHIVNYTFADNQIPEMFLYDSQGVKFNTVTKVEAGDAITSIGENAFNGCSGLTTCTIGSGVTSIGNYAFNNCYSLSSCTIGNSVTSIGGYAFMYCESLTGVTIPNSVTTIDVGAFYGCTSLTSIDIPSGVTSIGNSAFVSCSGLTSITVNSNNSIYDSRDNCNAIIKTSTNELVAGCKNTIIPSSVTSIGENAFNDCSSLTSIDIPSGVTAIGFNAFYQCSGLTFIAIPDSVTTIGGGAFSSCSGFMSVVCRATTPPTLGGNSVFNNTNNCPIYVPSASVDAYKAANKWSTYSSRIQAIP